MNYSGSKIYKVLLVTPSTVRHVMWQSDTQYVAQTQYLKRGCEKCANHGKEASDLIGCIDNERMLGDSLLGKLVGGLGKEV